MRAIICLLLLALPTLAWAQPGTDDDGTCRNGAFSDEQDVFSLAIVQVSRLYFLSDTDGCPARGEAACRGRSYVVKGDTLVIGRQRGTQVCAYFPNRGGGSAGWVAKASLQALPAVTPTLEHWRGQWHDGDNTLEFIPNRDGTVTVNGDAYWPSANPSPAARPGGPNYGNVSGSASPDGGRLQIHDQDCDIRMDLLKDVLVVNDNLNCGGANVSFRGVYRRRSAAVP